MRKPYYAGQRSDHFDGSLFFNPDGRLPGGFSDLARWTFGGGKVSWPKRFPSPFPQAVPQARMEGDALRVTMVGHAAMLIQTGGVNILTDPVWADRASPYSFAGPSRRNPPGIRFEDLPPIDAVLLSHNHYDHMDLATLARLVQAHDPLIVTPLGNDTNIAPAAPKARFAVGDWGDQIEVGPLTVHFEPAHHWSARGTRDRRWALWSAFAIEAPGGKIYFAGDTGFDGGRNFAAAHDKHGSFRFALLPIGAYEPRWFMEPHHQNPREAVEAYRLLGAHYAGGYHWGTFPLTNEGPDEPRLALFEALDQTGIERSRFRPLHPGEVWDIPPAIG